MTASRTAPRGRSVLLWGVVCFGLIQVLVGLFLDVRIVDRRFTVLRHHLQRLERGPQPEVICIGSSRTGSSVHDAELTRILRRETGEPGFRAFNSAFPVGDVVAVEFAVNRILERGIRPRLMVLELVPEEVARQNYWVSEHIRRQLTWADLPEHLRNTVTTGNLLRLLNSRMLPLLYFRKELLREVGLLPGVPEPTIPDDPEAGSSLDWTQILVAAKSLPNEVEARTCANIHGPAREMVGYAVGGPSRRALERTLVRLREAGIAVVLLGIPVASAHRNLYTAEIEGPFQAYLERLRVKFGIPYFDCRGRLEDEYFIDHHHANAPGAARFSQILARDYLAPYWREQMQKGRQ